MFIQFIKVPFVAPFSIWDYAEGLAFGVSPSGEYVETEFAIDDFEKYATGFRRFFKGSGFWLTSGSTDQLSTYFVENFDKYPTGFFTSNSFLSSSFLYQGYNTIEGGRTGNLYFFENFSFANFPAYNTGEYQYDSLNKGITTLTRMTATGINTGYLSKETAFMIDEMKRYDTGIIIEDSLNKNISQIGYNNSSGLTTGGLNIFAYGFKETFETYATGSAYTGTWLLNGKTQIAYDIFGTNGNTYRQGATTSWLLNSGSLSGAFSNVYATVVTGIINSGVAVNTGKYFQYPHDVAFNVNDFTCEFWAYRAGDWPQENSRFVDKGWSNGFALDRANTTDQVKAEINGEQLPTTNIKLSRQVWTHLAWVRQGSTLYTYSGGAAYGEAQPCGSETLSGSYPFTFGANGSTAPYGEFFNGVLGEIRFWNYARTSGQISANYNTKVNPSSPGLLLYLSN